VLGISLHKLKFVNGNFVLSSQIYELRRERRYMVQTVAQYAYVYKCVREHLRKKRAKSEEVETV
jgi:protein tyrosine phosphatase